LSLLLLSGRRIYIINSEHCNALLRHKVFQSLEFCDPLNVIIQQCLQAGDFVYCICVSQGLTSYITYDVYGSEDDKKIRRVE
jgi:hypothetical protein